VTVRGFFHRNSATAGAVAGLTAGTALIFITGVIPPSELIFIRATWDDIWSQDQIFPQPGFALLTLGSLFLFGAVISSLSGMIGGLLGAFILPKTFKSFTLLVSARIGGVVAGAGSFAVASLLSPF
jgi:hypothetical protein